MLLARSVDPDGSLEETLAMHLDSLGRSRDEIPALIEAERYTGVRYASDFTLVDRDGAEFTLSEHRGSVVLLCFWGYG
jgi:cytochrome oxidase Cu insertion factor (SCO1/SenC/PrrC family)